MTSGGVTGSVITHKDCAYEQFGGEFSFTAC